MVVMFTTSTILSPLHMGFGPGPYFPLFPILFLLALGALIWMFARRGRVGPVGWRPNGRPGPGHRGGFGPGGAGPEDQAMTILRERLARGDISPEEYLERSSVLGPARPADPPNA